MQCEIVGSFFELLSAIDAQQRLPVEYTAGQVLYHAEMGLLLQIYENPRANVSVLSHMSGVTKSAITQMSAKLMDKGLVEKYTTHENKKEKYFRLTQKGETVRLAQVEHYKEASNEMRSYLCSLEGRDKQTIMTFMEKMKKCVPLYALSCSCGYRDGECRAARRLEETC